VDDAQAPEQSDAELVCAVLEGETDAFAELVARYKNVVTTYVAARVPGPEVEDLAQEVFVRSFRVLESLREPKAFGAMASPSGRCSPIAALPRVPTRPPSVTRQPTSSSEVSTLCQKHTASPSSSNTSMASVATRSRGGWAWPSALSPVASREPTRC